MKTLVLHHSAGNQDRPAKDDWESGKRWYTWIIDGKGVLHTFKNDPNKRSCGLTFDLCFSGDLTKIALRHAQIEAWNKFRDSHYFNIITTHGKLAKDKPGCATASACPGKLLQFISLKPIMTCEEQLAQEKLDHAESIKQKDENYTAWQNELDRRKRLESMLADEVKAHKDTLEKLGVCEPERETLRETIRKIKEALV